MDKNWNKCSDILPKCCKEVDVILKDGKHEKAYWTVEGLIDSENHSIIWKNSNHIIVNAEYWKNIHD